jgi:hypothetical protein
VTINKELAAIKDHSKGMIDAFRKSSFELKVAKPMHYDEDT